MARNPVPIPYRSVVVVLAGSVALSAGAWVGLLGSARSSLSAAESDLADATAERDSLQEDAEALAGGDESLLVETLEQALAADALLPSTTDPVQAAVAIQQMISTAGLSFSQLVPGAAVDIEDAHALPFTVMLTGTAAQLRAFVALTATHPQVLTVDPLPYATDDAVQSVTTTIRVWGTTNPTVAELVEQAQAATADPTAAPTTNGPTAGPTTTPSPTDG